MDLIKHFWYLVHVERQKETVTLKALTLHTLWRHRKRLERCLFQLFSDNLADVFEIAG